MDRRSVVPDGVFDSRQFGFSQAVVARGGATVHVSGQVGWDPDTGAVGDTLADQVPVAFDNLERVLAACGGGLDALVALRLYVVEAAGSDLTAVGDELRRRFPQEPPAATWIRVAGLADPAMLFEVEATAAIP